VDAMVKTIFLFAATHLLILAFIAFRESIHVLNVFAILNLDAFLPWLGQDAGLSCRTAWHWGLRLTLFDKPEQKQE
jgi:hypothetical protein